MGCDNDIPSRWANVESDVARHIVKISNQCLAAYRANPLLVEEHANIERSVFEGGYEHRQIYELVQNGADEMLGKPGRIEIVLTDQALYCANEGTPITTSGVEALLGSNLSRKRGFEIGRFGVGFKSVLRISSAPQFFSSSGSFSFSQGFAEQQIRSCGREADKYPILRVAEPTDPKEGASHDSVLRELMTWASTVIKLPLLPDTGAWLGRDLANFPSEFVLFANHVSTVILDDRTRSLRREVRQTREGDTISLAEGDRLSRWKLITVQYCPTVEARRDAGELADRDVLPLSWAVPLEGRMGRGRFWAFFPTSVEMGLSGILNAPWKTNVDRQYLLPSKINEELIARAAVLVADSLAEILETEDPGWILNVLPGRIDESPPWADRFLNVSIYQCAKVRASVPDQFGVPRTPSELRCTPAHLPDEAYSTWSKFPERPFNWPHTTCESRERRARMERLFEGSGKAATPKEWLEALAADSTPQHSIAALRVASVLWHNSESPGVREEVRKAQIVLTLGGALVAPLEGKLFFNNVSVETSDLPVVHPAVSAHEESAEFLRELGVSEADDGGDFRHFIADGFKNFVESDWLKFWTFAEVLPEYVIGALDGRDDLHLVHVRTISGKFRPRRSVLLPGPVVDAQRDPNVAVDTEYHLKSMSVLKVVGINDKPIARGGELDELWGEKYKQDAVEAFRAALPKGIGQPRSTHISFWQTRSVGPLEPFYELSDVSKAKFTEYLLSLREPDWTIEHATRNSYPRVSFDAPSLWMAKRHGWISTSTGVRAVNQCVGPELRRWEKFFPVPDSVVDVTKLALPASLKDLRLNHWQEAMNRAHELQDIALLGDFYAEACLYRPAQPDQISCRIGYEFSRAKCASIAVVSSKRDLDALGEIGHPALFVEDTSRADKLVKTWGLIPGLGLVKTTPVAVPAGPDVAVLTYFPALQGCAPELEAATLTPCSDLRIETLTPAGKRSVASDWYVENDRVYYRANLDDSVLLENINLHFGLHLEEGEKNAILEHRKREDMDRKCAAVRSEPTLASRLVKAVGLKKIRKHLPVGLADAVESDLGRLTPEQTAELAFAAYGVDALREFRDDLAAAGLEPPNRWAGGNQAVEFAASLGFGKEFAGFEGARREPLLEIEGPPRLPRLHDFQETICDKLKRIVLRSDSSRGLLCLPTGAGKTRVVVQALIEAIKGDTLRGPIVWIAQSDELCEQAVRAWSDCWRALGDRRVLSLSRLWSTNRAHAIEVGPHVVIATIQKLNSCIGELAYKWLQGSSCIVVDEAHGAITPEYTNVLRVLGIDFSSREDKRDRCPLVGMTATPFRGHSEEETKRLVGRFGGNRLDLAVLGEDPYAKLQETGVLARVDHRLIDGSEISLSEEEEVELKRFQRLPATVEERLGADQNRNKSLIDSIRSLEKLLGPGWTAILFAASVQHAQVMAAMLNFSGIRAAAVSYDTDAGARRHYVEKFRTGEISVLTNYGVLTQGFDAPSVRAIYVARPTFSPNIYQQMIGRGLRGPKNGGKERCLIVNVRDNLERYGLTLAFRHFDHLWKGIE